MKTGELIMYSVSLTKETY